MNDEAYQRAAIIVGSLDRSAADKILDRLPEQQSLAIRNAMIATGESTVTERDHTIEAFLGIRKATNSSPLDDSDWPSDLPRAEEVKSTDSSLQELLSFDDGLIAMSIVYERTSVVAAFLNALPRKRAAGVLCQLPHEVQSRAVAVLDMGIRPRQEFIDVMADVICEMHAEDTRNTQLTAKHQDALQAIFDELSSSERQQMLHDIARENPMLAQRLMDHGNVPPERGADCYC